jgi:hypothetical protein
MLPAIDFDNEALFSASEIDDERVNRSLSHEFVAVEHPGAQSVPKFGFCLC